MTLRELLAAHPEYADLPVVIYCADGHYDWVGLDEGAGNVYVSELDPNGDDFGNNNRIPVLVFSPN